MLSENFYHFHAFFHAFAAGFGAFLAMLVVVLFTFFGTFPAKLRAHGTKLFGTLASKAHHLSRCVAQGGTLHIKLHTSCHHFYIFFFKTGRSAMVTKCCTFQAGFYTLFIIMIIHNGNFKIASTNNLPFAARMQFLIAVSNEVLICSQKGSAWEN
jgi:hypothetical protein